MHNTLARLKKAGSHALAQGQAGGSGGSHATGSGPATAAGAPASMAQQHGDAAAPAPAYAPMSMAEKTLPPGAAGYVHPNNRWDNARSERDEIERALRLSQEEEEYRDAIKASQDAEEAAFIERNRQLQLEEEALRASRAEHEAHEDQLAIAQAEEEHAILEALRASEREHERILQRRQRRRSSATAPVGKGKQRGSTGESRDVDPTGASASTSTPGPDGEESDEEVRRAMQLSLADQEDERREQEEIFAEAKRKRLSLTSASGPSTSAAADAQTSTGPSSQRLPTSPRPVSMMSASSSASHLQSPSSPSSISTMTFCDRPTRPPPPPPQSQPQDQLQQSKSPPRQRPPQLPQRRRLPEAEDYESMVDVPPPAYEPSPGGPSAGANPTSPASHLGRNASAQSQSMYSTATEGGTAHTPMGSVGIASPTATDASSMARQQAEALEEKRQIFYPPVANNEMAEGTMRAFVPHMLFAARARNRSDPDEYLPMVSRDLDMQDLPAASSSPPSASLPSSPQALSNSTGTNGTRPRRPLPPLPAGGSLKPDSGTQGPSLSALQQLDQKMAATSADSHTQPRGYYRASDHPITMQVADASPNANEPDRRASQVQSVSSTAAAVEDEDQQDPFDDSQAASPVSGSDDGSSDGRRRSAADDDGTGSDTADEDYYNDHPSATIRSSKHPFSAIKGDASSSTHNNLSHAPSSASEDSIREQEDRRPESTSSPEGVVERHDYARASPQQVGSDGLAHLPPAVSPEPQSERQAIASQQRELAAGGTAGYASDESAMSWESTGSEDDSAQAREPLNESAKDINTNISFGFNPLSSPNQYLDWQGRFPDLIVLSRFSDTPAGDREQSVSANVKEDYRTFAFEAPTWRELIAYLMWHGNSIFEASSKDKESSAANSLRVSLILEFVKTVAPPSTMVRLQIHLLSAGAATPGSAGDAGDGGVNASRGVALSRSPLSSRPTNYVRSNLPWQQDSSKGSTHLVLAFPKPYHSLPFNLGTIGSHLHNAHRAAVVQHTQQASDNRIRLSDKSRISNTQFLADLLRGIDICTDTSEKTNAASNSQHVTLHGRKHSSGGQHVEQDHESPDDSRFNKLVGRMRQKRHDMRGTFREMHKRSQTRRRERQLAKGKGKGKGTAQRNSSDSDQSHLESQPKAEDYHITPFPDRA